jgi:signal transduction histidine kinase
MAAAAVVVLVGIGLYALSRRNYLLYHSLAELFSIVVATGVFMIAFSSRFYGESLPFVFLGISYLAVAVLDTFYVLAYPGMAIFENAASHAHLVWVAARFLEALSLTLFVAIPSELRRLPVGIVILVYGLVAATVLTTVLVWDVFPPAFGADAGWNLFKILSEVIITGILISSLFFLRRNRTNHETIVFKLIALSIVATIASQLFFAVYADSYGATEFAGRLLRMASLVLVYKAIIEVSLSRPYETISRDLRENEADLRAANATKDRFFSIIAHDLKNPVHGIAELSKLTLKHSEGMSNEEQRNQLELIRDSADMAVDLLEKLLIWARSQTGRLRVNPNDFDLEAVAVECKRLSAVQATEKGVAIANEVSPDTMVHADPNMVTTVLRNLLVNGIKFTRPGGIVRVSAESGDGQIVVSVRDTGVGMSPEELDQLFQIDSNRTKWGTEGESGTGLGLIICKEFVERNGGNIWATSRVGMGSTVYFTLPIGKN